MSPAEMLRASIDATREALERADALLAELPALSDRELLAVSISAQAAALAYTAIERAAGAEREERDAPGGFDA